METPRRILVVDDEPDFTAALRAVLADKPYELVTARNRVQAEEMARAQRPDMFLVGTMAPRGDAFRLHQWVKATPRFQGLPMVVIDAPWEKQLIMGWSREEGLRLDADEYLVKPIAPASLVPLIEHLLYRASSTAQEAIKVLIVDDHTVVREGIRALLSLQRDMQVVGEAVNGRDALEKAHRLSPDVVLMDVSMPIMNGLDATEQICKGCDQAKVLMLTQYDNHENVVASSKVGALGFVPKTSASSELLAGIRAVSKGLRYMHLVAA